MRKINELEAVFRSPDITAGTSAGPNGILARLLRRIWLDNNFKISHIDQRIDEHLKKSKSQAALNPNGKAPPGRNALRKAMAAPGQTWRNLLHNLAVLGAVRVDIAARVYFDASGRRSTITVLSIPLNTLDMDLDQTTSEEGPPTEGTQTDASES